MTRLKDTVQQYDFMMELDDNTIVRVTRKEIIATGYS